MNHNAPHFFVDLTEVYPGGSINHGGMAGSNISFTHTPQPEVEPPMRFPKSAPVTIYARRYGWVGRRGYSEIVPAGTNMNRDSILLMQGAFEYSCHRARIILEQFTITALERRLHAIRSCSVSDTALYSAK